MKIVIFFTNVEFLKIYFSDTSGVSDDEANEVVVEKSFTLLPGKGDIILKKSLPWKDSYNNELRNSKIK